MDCPVCHVELKMADRQGVEIDYCPKCRGVWLDRGELDKLIERSGAAFEARRERDDDYRPDDRDRHEHEHYGHESYGHKKHKRRSFLGDIFDFD